MKKFLVTTAVVSALVLSGCAINRADFDTEEAYQARVAERQARLEAAGRFAEAARLIAISQIEIWNSAEIDPIQWDENRLLKASAFCGTATAIMTVIDPEMESLSNEGAQWCGVVVKALAAAPEVAPGPAPEPEPAPAPAS